MCPRITKLRTPSDTPWHVDWTATGAQGGVHLSSDFRSWDRALRFACLITAQDPPQPARPGPAING